MTSHHLHCIFSFQCRKIVSLFMSVEHLHTYVINNYIYKLQQRENDQIFLSVLVFKFFRKWWSFIHSFRIFSLCHSFYIFNIFNSTKKCIMYIDQLRKCIQNNIGGISYVRVMNRYRNRHKTNVYSHTWRWINSWCGLLLYYIINTMYSLIIMYITLKLTYSIIAWIETKQKIHYTRLLHGLSLSLLLCHMIFSLLLTLKLIGRLSIHIHII